MHCRARAVHAGRLPYPTTARHAKKLGFTCLRRPKETLLLPAFTCHCPDSLLAGSCPKGCRWLPTPACLGVLRCPAQVNPVARKAGEIREGGVSEALQGVGRPMCCDYDGLFIVMGFDDGMVRASVVGGVCVWWGWWGGAATLQPAGLQHGHARPLPNMANFMRASAKSL